MAEIKNELTKKNIPLLNFIYLSLIYITSTKQKKCKKYLTQKELIIKINLTA